MGKPKDAKIWNEDLVKALDARYQKAQREGKRDVHLWRIGRDKILAVRKDIYMYRSGNIANLPSNLKKTVQRLCEDVIRGVKNVYPDGHVPTNQEQNSSFEVNLNTPHKANVNPFQNDRYVRDIKIGSGAFAILMAFRYSMTEILTKRDICREAQKFCDSEMEANFHAGRTYGAWKGIDTLKNKNYVKDQGYRTYTPNGFRDRPHSYSLTRDGEMFIEALLANRPEAVEAARKAAGRDPRTPFATGSAMGTPNTFQSHSPVNFLSPILPRSSDPASKLANMESDRAKLEEWLSTAKVGERIEFKVGKDRRLRLHKLCDALQRHHPGLRLTHGSSGYSRGRTLSVQLLSKSIQSISAPLTNTSSRKLPPAEITETAYSSYSESGKSVRQKAGLAAIKRQEEAMEEIQLNRAILESKKMTPQSNNTIQREQYDQLHTPSTDGDSDLKRAIQASLRDTKRKVGVKRNIFATVGSSSSSDEDLPGPFMSPSKRPRIIPISEEDRKPAAKKTRREIFCIDSESENEKGDRHLRRKLPPISSKHHSKKKNRSTKMASKKKRGLPKEASTPNSIDLCESTDDEDDVLEIRESQEEIIDLSKSQLSQDQEFIGENLEATIDLSNSQLSQDGDCIHESNSNSVAADDDDIIIVQNSQSNIRCPEKTKNLKLTVWIDNRERNRNATPRTLRNELTRHLSTGSLRLVWPPTLPLAKVEETKLDWGDIQYSVQSGSSRPSWKQKLGVSIERKRVNDLVQRSARGEHLAQLFRMKQHCSLSVLLIENDTRTAQSATPYNAQDNEGLDPFDTTVRCEDDIYRMFGRIVLTCDSVKFMQTRDEQASLRSIGALGLMAIFAPSNRTKELRLEERNLKGSQGLSDQLKEAGIPWRMAKRVASIVGGPIELKALYDSCCNEVAKSELLSHTISLGDQDDLRSSSSGWSDAIYRIITCISESPSSDNKKLSGEAALLLHKELIEDHGKYLSFLYQGHSPEESLEKILDSPPSSSLTKMEAAPRYVNISFTEEQAKTYFAPTNTNGAKSFYRFSILSDDQSKRQSRAISMKTVSQSLSSQPLFIFEMEGSDIVDLVLDNWGNENEKDYVLSAKRVAQHLVTNHCHLEESRSKAYGASKRILMVCGLQPALDTSARKPGYSLETKTLIDLVFAELMLSYDVTILQALRKKSDDRVNLVKQLALSCFHCAFLIQNDTGSR